MRLNRCMSAEKPAGSEALYKALRLITLKRKSGLQMVWIGRVGVNERTSFGTTPLSRACYSLWADGVKSLLAMGANPQLTQLCGVNAAQVALLGAMDHIEREPCRARWTREVVLILDDLISYGPIINANHPVPDWYLKEVKTSAEVTGHALVAHAVQLMID